MGNMHKEYPFIALLIAGLVLFTPFSITAYEGDDLEIRSINAQIIESLEEDITELERQSGYKDGCYGDME